MTRVICLTTSYPLSDNDISGHFVRQLNQIYQSAGYQVTVICFAREPANLINPLDELIDDMGIRVITVPVIQGSMQGGAPDRISREPWKSLIHLPINTIRFWRAFGAEKKRLNKLVGDVKVVAHWSLPSGLLAKSSQPIIYCHGGDVALIEQLPFGQYLARSIFTHATKVICVSHNLKERIEYLTGPLKQAQVIPMGVDEPNPCHSFEYDLKKIINGRFVISTVGRIESIKGYDLLLEALAILNPSIRKDIIWLMAGQGSLLDSLVEKAKGLEVNLKSLGEIKGVERDALLSLTNVFVAPSRQVGTRIEGSPLSLREAALSGCLLVATTMGGVQAILDRLPQEMVFGVEATVEQLHTAISRCLNLQIDQDIRQNMIDIAKDNWTWQALAGSHLNVLE